MFCGFNYYKDLRQLGSQRMDSRMESAASSCRARSAKKPGGFMPNHLSFRVWVASHMPRAPPLTLIIGIAQAYFVIALKH